MDKLVTILFLITLLFEPNKFAQDTGRSIYIDTDCGTDDILAIALLLESDNIQIIGISIVQGLTDVEDGAKIIRGLLDDYGLYTVPVYLGKNYNNSRINHFPNNWKKQTTEIGLSLFNSGKKNENIKNFEPLKFVSTLNSIHCTILALGPLTNINELTNSGLKNSTPIIVMGGAIHVKGNLDGNGELITENKYSEWNFFSDPLAAKKCIDYFTNVRLVPLDATNSVQIDSSYLSISKWNNRRSKQSYLILQKVNNWIIDGQYYAWDPLAAAYLLNNNVLEMDSINVSIGLTTNDVGRTIISGNGNKIIYAKRGNKILFDKIFFNMSN